MLGDSVTAGTDWAEWFPDVGVSNHGIDGNATTDVLQRLDSVLAVRPRRVLLMVGINDVNRGVDPEVTFSAYLQILRRLKDAGVEVVVQSTLECAREICGKRVQAVRALNDRLKRHAAAHGLAYVDLNATMSDPQAGLLAQFTSDGVHLTEAGYEAWRAVVRPCLEPMSTRCGRDPRRQ